MLKVFFSYWVRKGAIRSLSFGGSGLATVVLKSFRAPSPKPRFALHSLRRNADAHRSETTEMVLMRRRISPSHIEFCATWLSLISCLRQGCELERPHCWT